MSALPQSLDTAFKRWFAVLAVVFLASLGILTRSFINASLPPAENAITVEPRAPRTTEQVTTRNEPAWDNLQAVHEVEPTHPDGRVSPFAALDAAEARDDPAKMQERVHQQAEYLRNLIVKGQLPRGLGHLTKERVDEMEKKGIMID
jgi:hypothetical protein